MKKDNKNIDKKEVAKKILKKGLNITSYICTGLLLTLFLVSGVTSCNNKANKKQVESKSAININDDKPNNIYKPNSYSVVVPLVDFNDYDFFMYTYNSILEGVNENQYFRTGAYIGLTQSLSNSSTKYNVCKVSQVPTSAYRSIFFYQSDFVDVSTQPVLTTNDLFISLSLSSRLCTLYGYNGSSWVTSTYASWFYSYGIYMPSTLIDPNAPYLYGIFTGYNSYIYNNGYTAGQTDGYTAGESDGYNTGYSEGYVEGEATGYAGGRQTGYSDGYTAGESDGYNTGYTAGQSDGYNTGYTAGQSDGYNTGYTAGQSDGYNTGYTAGESDGYNTGYSDGYGTGYNDGVIAGNHEYDERYLQITINEFYPAGLLSLNLKRVGVWSANAVDPALDQRYHTYGIVFHHVPFISNGKEYDTIMLRISKGYDSLKIRNATTGNITTIYPDNVKDNQATTTIAQQLFFVDSLLYLKSANNNLFGSPIGDDGLSDYYEYWDVVAYNYFNGVESAGSDTSGLYLLPNSYAWTDVNYKNIQIDKQTYGYSHWYDYSAYGSAFYNYNTQESSLKDTGGKRLTAMTDSSLYSTNSYLSGTNNNNVFSLLQRAFSAVTPIFERDVVAGVTIGSLIFLPLLVSVIIAVIKLLKR